MRVAGPLSYKLTKLGAPISKGLKLVVQIFRAAGQVRSQVSADLSLPIPSVGSTLSHSKASLSSINI